MLSNFCQQFENVVPFLAANEADIDSQLVAFERSVLVASSHLYRRVCDRCRSVGGRSAGPLKNVKGGSQL